MATIKERIEAAKRDTGAVGIKRGTSGGSIQERLAAAKRDTGAVSAQALSAMRAKSEQERQDRLQRMAQREPVDTARNDGRKFAAVNLGDTGGVRTPTDYEIVEQQKKDVDARIKELEEIEAVLVRLEMEQQNTLPEYRKPVEYKGYTSSDDVFRELRSLRSQSGTLANQYYREENEARKAEMSRDPAAASAYADAGKAREEADKVLAILKQVTGTAGGQMSWEEYEERVKYLKDTYNISDGAIAAAGRSREYTAREGGYDNLWQLYDELIQRAETGEQAVGERGYDFRRLAGYDERLKNSAAAAVQDRKLAGYVSRSEGAATAANAVSVLASMAKGAEYVGALLGNLGHNSADDLGRYVPLDTSKMGATRFVDTVRETSAKKIEADAQNKGWGKVQSFLYQTGMSIVDSAATIAVFGAAAPVVLGGSAAASATKNIMDRGGTSSQALWGGAAAGAAEMLFEKFSVERLLTPQGVTGWKSWLKNALQQAGTEASEEMLTEVANILSDAAIMGRKSEFDEAVRRYMTEENLAEEQARRKVFLDCVTQVGLAGLGGALSGGAMGGFQGAVEYAGNRDIIRAGKNAVKRHEAADKVFDRIEGQKETASKVETEVKPSVFEQAIMDTAAQGRQLQAEKETAARTPQDETMERVLAEMNASKRGQGNNPSVSSADTSPYTGEAMGAPAAQVSAQGTTVKTDTAARTNAPAASQGAKPKMGVVDARTAKDAVSLRNVLSDREVLYLDRVAQAAGIRINIVDAQYGEGAADGWYENGEIYLTENCEDPVAWVATHELTHHLERAAPEAYRQYQEYVKKILTDEGGLEEQIARIRQHYAERNVDLTEEGAMRELAANFTERLRLDEDLFRRIAGENRNLAQRLLDSLKEFIRKIRTTWSGQEIRDLEATRKAWEKALRESRGKTVEGGERQYAIRKTGDGRSYVQADRQVIFGNDPESWSEQLEDYINGKIRRGQDVQLIAEDGDVLALTARTAGKVADMHYGDGTTMSDAAFERKVNAGAHIDELAQVSTRGKKIVEDHEGRHGETAQGGWNYRTAFFRDFDGKYYKCTVSVEMGVDGNAVYNIGKMEERSFPDISGSSAKGGAGSGKTSFGDSISDVAEKSNSEISGRQNSLRGARDLEHQVADLQKQNARLQARNEELRSRLESGGAVKVDEAEAKRMAKQLLKDFSSGYDAKRLAERLRAFYDKAGGRGAVGPVLRQEAEAIARDVLAEVSVMGEAGTALREILRSTKIHVPRELWDGFENEGGYNTFRQKYMGRLQLNATEGRSIDEVYEELSLDHPELFDMDGITDPVNRLLQISEVADSLRFASENLSAADRVNVELLSGEIMERFYDLAQKDLPYTEGRARERSDAQKRLRESLAKRERESARRIENIRKSNREAAKRAQERMSTTKLRDSIRRHADALSRKLTRPTDKQHIPERLQGSVLALLEVIDLESKYGYRFTRDATFRRVNVDEDGHLEPTARTTAARALKAAYEELRSDPEFNNTVDPDLADMLEEIAEMGDIRVADMNLEQLQTVWRAVRAVEASVTKSDKMLGASKFGRVSVAADALKAEMGDRKDRKNLVGALGRVDQLLNLDMLTPETFLHRMGRVGEDIHDQMRRAQDKNVEILKEGVEFYKRTAAETGVDMLKAEKDMHTFKVSGGTIELTTAQVMELYALSKRQAAMEHIYKGGIRAQGGRKGLVETGQSKAVRVTFMDVADILGVLTPEQKKFVDTLQGYMSTRLAAHGNEASMEVYDYEKFKEKAYWPIKVSKTETDTDPAAEARAKTIPGFGMTKTLKPHASNSVMLRSALDSFGEHLNQMATYAAWLTTSENITKLINYDFMAEGVRTGTVKDLLLKIYGKGGEQYLADLMSDVAQGTKTGSEKSALTDSMFGRWKAAKVGANIRVVLQQPTAILRAAEMIDPKYMAAAGNPMKGWRKAVQWSPIAQWKDWGYFELDAGRSMRELMAGTDSKLDKVKNASMWAAGKMDNVAWGMLWNAVEAETKAKRSDLKVGSDDFYRAVAKRFGEVIDRTQVVDSVLHRTQIMRSSNALNRMATSFMSEPSKIYNMVIRDIYDIANAEKGSAEYKRAWKHVARTGVALVASFAVNAVAQSIADALRDDDRDKKYLEKLGDAYLENFLQNFDPFGYLPYVKDVESLIQGFTVDRPDMEGLADLVNAAKSLGKAVSGEGNKTLLNAGFNAACKALDALGLPASNVKRDLAGIFSTALQAFGAHEVAYRVDKLMLKTDASGNAGAFYDTLYRAMNDDYDAYVKIYNDMVKEGVSPDNIMSAMEKRMAAELGLTKTVMLPTDWYAPGKNKQFDEMLKKQLEDGKTWANAADPDMVSLAIELEALQPEEGKSSVSNQQRMRAIADSEYDESVKELAMERVMTPAAYGKYIAARDAGVSTYAYMDLLEDIMAETVARRGESGSASQDDVLKALKRSGLTAAQKRAVWYSYGYKSESPWG